MRALIIVDVQNDFLPGGPLAVPEGDAVIPLANRLAERYPLVVATRDWHPPDHVSFVDNHPGREVGEVIDAEGLEQTLWPRHCVQGTEGAAFPPSLDLRRVDWIFHKGQRPELDSYSALFSNGHRRPTGLDGLLRSLDVSEVHICGLALNVCVHATALDARRQGYETYVIRDATRGVELEEGAIDHAVAEMADAGARIVTVADVLGGRPGTPSWRSPDSPRSAPGR